LAAIRMWVCTHATTASRSKRSKVIPEFATFIKQFARPVTLHPLFELANVPCVAEVRQWHLVRPPSPLHRFAINELWSRPALGRAENDHGPARSIRPIRPATVARGVLDLPDLRQDLVQRGGKLLMHVGGIVAFYNPRVIAIAVKEFGEFLLVNAS